MKTASERNMSTGNQSLRRTRAKARVMDFLKALLGDGQTARQRLAVFGLRPPRKLRPVRIRR